MENCGQLSCCTFQILNVSYKVEWWEYYFSLSSLQALGLVEEPNVWCGLGEHHEFEPCHKLYILMKSIGGRFIIHEFWIVHQWPLWITWLLKVFFLVHFRIVPLHRVMVT